MVEKYMAKREETRKGPWTEEEDMQLVCYVGLLGDRRWDFVAKASGLRRTGKSCRLRWVNYLHPGLKHGRMSPQEERLVLELHARWGNRWSKIARKLPGRTDNEIKNYWRTHMRKEAQERRRKGGSSAPPHLRERGPESVGNDGIGTAAAAKVEESGGMDQIWAEIASCEDCVWPSVPMASLPLWDYCGCTTDDTMLWHQDIM